MNAQDPSNPKSSPEQNSTPLGNGQGGPIGNVYSGPANPPFPSPPQRTGGDSTVNPDTIPAGGKDLKADPPGNRDGMVAPNERRSFKLKG